MKTRRNRSNIQAILLCLLLPLSIVTGCNRRELGSHWAGGTITIDGDMSDWPDSTRTYLKKDRAVVGISNDGENLYLLFRFGEPGWLTAMAMGDLTVWVDTSGNRRRDLGFRYSGGIDRAGAAGAPAGRSPAGGRRPTGGDRSGRTGQRPGGARDIEPPALEVVTEDTVNRVSLNGAEGPSARSSMIDRMFTLEMKIPIRDQPGDGHAIAVGPGEPVMLGFELAIDKDRIGEIGRGGGISVGMPGAGRGGRGGGIGGGMGVGRGAGMSGGPGGSTLPREQKIWVETILAEPPG